MNITVSANTNGVVLSIDMDTAKNLRRELGELTPYSGLYILYDMLDDFLKTGEYQARIEPDSEEVTHE